MVSFWKTKRESQNYTLRKKIHYLQNNGKFLTENYVMYVFIFTHIYSLKNYWLFKVLIKIGLLSY